MASAEVLLTLRDNVSNQLGQTNAAYQALSVRQQQAETRAINYANAQLRAAASDQRLATEEQRTAIQTANAAAAKDRAAIAALRLAAANEKASSGAGSFAQQIGGAVTSNLLGMLGPAALVTTAFTAATATVQSFADAFKFNAQLEQNKASITAQLVGIRDSSQAFSEAAIFAQKYKLTQEETTTAIQASVPLLRQSKSSLTDVLTVLAKLQVLKPEQGISGAAFALAELQGGQSRSLATRFNIPIAKATEMKNEIVKGADAVVVLGKYLDNAGIGAQALEARTKGAAGALNDLAQAEERRKIAQAGSAGGLGLTIVQAQTNANNALANALSSNANALYAAAKAADSAYNDAIARGATETDAAKAKEDARIATLRRFTDAASQAAVAEAEKARAANAPAIAQAADADDRRLASIQPTIGVALRAADADERRAASALSVTNAIIPQIAAMDAAAQKSAADAAAKDAQQAKTALLEEKSRLVVDTFLALNPQIDASAAASLAAAQGYSPQIQQLIALAIEARGAKAALAELNGAGSVTEGRSERDRPGDRAAAAAAGADAGRQRVAAAEEARRDQIRKTGTIQQRIALDQIELQEAIAKSGKGSAQAIAAETQLISDRQSTVKAHTGELNKQLNIHESIYDSQNKQIDAQISLNKLSAEGVLKTLDENKKLRTANAILANANASDEQRQRAQANIDIIAADRAERAQKARELGATAGGTITKTGKLLQSVPGSGDAPIGPPPPGVAGAQPSAAAAAGAPALKLVDQAGRIIAELVGPFIMDDLLKGVRSVAVTK